MLEIRISSKVQDVNYKMVYSKCVFELSWFQEIVCGRLQGSLLGRKHGQVYGENARVWQNHDFFGGNA
jgi:hypothetical protein